MSNDAPECAPPQSTTDAAPSQAPGPSAGQPAPHGTAWITPATPPPLPGTLGAKLGSVTKAPVPPSSATSTAMSSTPRDPAASGRYGSRPQRSGQRRAAEERQPTPEALQFRTWKDEVVGAQGYPATGFYVERYWGPIVGPTTLMLYRTVARELEAEPDGFSVVTNKLANTVGCSARTGSTSQFWRAVRRASRFGLLRQQDDRISVRPAVGLLPSRMAQRLPQELRQEHRIWIHEGLVRSGEAERAPAGSLDPDSTAFTDELLGAPKVPLALELLRAAARGLCTPEELRILDNQHRLV